MITIKNRIFRSQSGIRAIVTLLVVIFSCQSQSYASDRAYTGGYLALLQCVNPTSNERWPVKTLSDGIPIDSLHPTTTTVRQLGKLTPPAGVTAMTAPRSPVETHVYTIHALLQEYKLEPNDNDFHIVISDFGGSANTTMIAEIPDSQCTGVSGDGWTAEFDSMRSALEARFGTASPSFIQANAEVTITGVLFFDKPHGQTGHAPNYVELHPVLALKFGLVSPPTGAPTAAPNPTPTVRPTTAPTASPMITVPEFATAAAAQLHCPSDVVVWLNTRTNLYHQKGHRYYGTTLYGAYVCQQEAEQAGYEEGS
jgi:hypothetical protein